MNSKKSSNGLKGRLPDTTMTVGIDKNKSILIPELKRRKVDTFQIVNNIYKYSENTRVQARASTEIYEQLLHYLQQKIQFNNKEDKQVFGGAVAQAEKLVTFGFGQAKFQDNDVKGFPTKALRVPAVRDLIEPGDYSGEAKLTRCIHRTTYPPKFKTIFSLQKPRHNIPIQSTKLRIECCIKNFFKNTLLRHRTFKKTRDTTGLLFGRHLSTITGCSRVSKNSTQGNRTFGIVGIHHKQMEKFTDAITHSGVLGL